MKKITISKNKEMQRTRQVYYTQYQRKTTENVFDNERGPNTVAYAS